MKLNYIHVITSGLILTYWKPKFRISPHEPVDRPRPFNKWPNGIKSSDEPKHRLANWEERQLTCAAMNDKSMVRLRSALNEGRKRA